jgi:hypothetical protein
MKATPIAEPEPKYLETAAVKAFKSTQSSRNGGAEQNSAERSSAVSAPENYAQPTIPEWFIQKKAVPPSPPSTQFL